MPDSYSLELAQTSAELTWQSYAAQLQTTNHKLNAELLARAHKVTSSMNYDTPNDDCKINASIIKAVSNLLPKPQEDGEFSTANPLMWHQLKGSVLWFSGANSSWARFPIGYRKNNLRMGKLMLLATEYDMLDFHQIIDVKSVHPIFITMMQKVMQTTRETLPTETELREAYDQESKEFVLRAASSGTLKMKYSSSIVPAFIAAPKLVRRERTLPLEFGVLGEKIGPSDKDMAEYGVFAHLGRLAARFGFTDEYKEILEKAEKTDELEPDTTPTHDDINVDPELHNSDNLR